MTQSKAEQKLYSDQKLDTTAYKCPNCGGEAFFDPATQTMMCKYCASSFSIDTLSVVQEKQLDELLSKANVWQDTEVYQCQSCGAKAILTKQKMALTCSFCGTSNVVKTEQLAGLKPQGIVPFKIDADDASNVAKSWAKHKFFAPTSFKKSANPQNIYGVYNPVFTFDSQTKSTYDGRLGKHYTTVTYVNGKPVTNVHTRYFNVKGEYNVNFDDILVVASSNISNDILYQLLPFPTNKAIGYKSEFLRGYTASTYNKNGKQCWNESKNIMKSNIQSQILDKYDYDVKDYLNIDTSFYNNKYKYILVPVYVGHYTYKNKLYNFYINGDNATITGKTPVSGWKVFFTVLLSLLILVGLILVFCLNDTPQLL